jgi:hypothetical protein
LIADLDRPVRRCASLAYVRERLGEFGFDLILGPERAKDWLAAPADALGLVAGIPLAAIRSFKLRAPRMAWVTGFRVPVPASSVDGATHRRFESLLAGYRLVVNGDMARLILSICLCGRNGRTGRGTVRLLFTGIAA